MATASWYKDYANPSYVWQYRAYITVDVGSSTGSRDAQITIPADWDEFWTTVRSAGQDIRVTAADGVTLVTFDLAAGFSTSTRAGVIEVDNYTVPGTGSRVYGLWVYWGQADCATGVTAIVPSTPDLGYIELSRPGIRQVSAAPERPGDTTPRGRISKRSTETVHVWVRLADLLAIRREAHSRSLDYESVSTLTYDVQLATVSQAAMISVPSARIVEHDGELWARVNVAAGSDDATYTLLVTIGTTLGQTLTGSALVQVINTSE